MGLVHSVLVILKQTLQVNNDDTQRSGTSAAQHVRSLLEAVNVGTRMDEMGFSSVMV